MIKNIKQIEKTKYSYKVKELKNPKLIKKGFKVIKFKHRFFYGRWCLFCPIHSI
jgi:hypothetical protein